MTSTNGSVISTPYKLILASSGGPLLLPGDMPFLADVRSRLRAGETPEAIYENAHVVEATRESHLELYRQILQEIS